MLESQNSPNMSISCPYHDIYHGSASGLSVLHNLSGTQALVGPPLGELCLLTHPTFPSSQGRWRALEGFAPAIKCFSFKVTQVISTHNSATPGGRGIESSLCLKGGQPGRREPWSFHHSLLPPCPGNNTLSPSRSPSAEMLWSLRSLLLAPWHSVQTNVKAAVTLDVNVGLHAWRESNRASPAGDHLQH